VRTLPSANGKLAVMGFCWGGSRTWEAANTIEDVAVVMPFYGTGPSTDDGASGIEAPVYGFYGGADARVNATIDTTKVVMDKLGKPYEPVIYPGAGHAFMRLGEEGEPSQENRTARDESWKRLLTILGAIH
jgi:carboxymethylenebutenolidase